MSVDIAGEKYELVFVHGELRHEGERYPVICDHGAHEIRVSDELTGEQQASCVATAVCDCWRRASSVRADRPRFVGEVD
jgi:hypothetical protein